MNKLKALLLITIFALGSLGTVYGANQNFIFDDEFLVDTATWNNTQYNADNSTDVDIIVKWGFHFPANATVNPEPVKADPDGIFYELLIGDKARIFSAAVERIAEVIEEVIEEIIEFIEPEPVYTTEEQNLIDNVYKYCEQLSDRLEAIGRAHEFEYETDEFYATHEIDAIKDSEDCRARLHLGDNILSSMYNALAEEAALDAEAFNQTITTDISEIGEPTSYSVDGDMWNKRAGEAMDDAKKLPGIGLTYDESFKELYQTTATYQNAPTDEQLAIEEHEQRQLANVAAWESACTSYWIESGEGSLGLTKWDTHLLNGDCEGFILDNSDPTGESFIDIAQAMRDRAELEIRIEADIKQKQIDRAEEAYERIQNGTK